jgi:predicted secreted protein
MSENISLKGVKLWIENYDSKKKYPQLVGTENEWCLFERWEIKVENLTHKRLDKLIGELNNVNLSMDNLPFEFYSES